MVHFKLQLVHNAIYVLFVYITDRMMYTIYILHYNLFDVHLPVYYYIWKFV